MVLGFAISSLILSVVVYTGLARYAWRRRTALGTIATAGFIWTAGLALWTAAYAIELMAADAVLKTAMHCLRTVISDVVSGVAFVFAAHFASERRWLRQVSMIIFYCLSGLSLVVVLTNHDHNLLWARVTIHTMGDFSVVRVAPGLLGGLMMTISYGVYTAAIILLMQRFVGAARFFRRQLGALVVALVFPLLAALLFAGGATALDPTPYTLCVSGLAVAWALARYNLFDVLPVARNQVINSINDGMIVVDPFGRIAEVNPAAARMIGRPVQELVGSALRASCAPIAARFNEHDGLLQPLQGDGEMTFAGSEGEGIAEIQVTALGTERRRPPAYVITLRDISERKHIQRALEQALQCERELNQLRARFVSIISHEFRTPMTVIQTSSELLKHYGERMEAQARANKLTMIDTQIGVMNNLIDDVLSLERIQSGKLGYSPTCLPAAETVRSLIDEILDGSGDKERIRLSAPHDDVRIMLDKKLLRLIIRNLVSNALKYSPQNMAVEVSLVIDTTHVHVHVRDHGIGIPEADQSRLFDPFYRAANVGDLPGSGLGLMIVKQAAEQHGARISFTSQPDAGSTFSLALPLAGQ